MTLLSVILPLALQITGGQAGGWELPDAAAEGSVEFTQCRFRSGARLMLFRPGRHGDYEMFFVSEDGTTDPSSISEVGSHLEIETNGGVASLNAVGTLFRELKGYTFARVRADEVRVRLGDRTTPLCRNPYKDGTR